MLAAAPANRKQNSAGLLPINALPSADPGLWPRSPTPVLPDVRAVGQFRHAVREPIETGYGTVPRQ
jgi:hypothetical protein